MSFKSKGLKPFCDIFDIDTGLPYVICIRRVIGEYQQISVIVAYRALYFTEPADQTAKVFSTFHVIEIYVVGTVLVLSRKAAHHDACVSAAVLCIGVASVLYYADCIEDLERAVT